MVEGYWQCDNCGFDYVETIGDGYHFLTCDCPGNVISVIEYDDGAPDE